MQAVAVAAVVVAAAAEFDRPRRMITTPPVRAGGVSLVDAGASVARRSRFESSGIGPVNPIPLQSVNSPVTASGEEVPCKSILFPSP